MNQISKGKIKNPRTIDGRPIFPVFVAILSFSFVSNGTLCVTVVGRGGGREGRTGGAKAPP